MDTSELTHLLNEPEESIDLGRAALLLARTEYPDLDVNLELAQLDRLAAEAAPYIRSQADPADRLTALRLFLADVCGFRGDEDNYYDPKNSFLNAVLERRTGIPITLAVVYMEVGRRLGVPLHGVGLPGHFLLRHGDGAEPLFLDPFNRGRTVTANDCRELVSRMYQGQLEFREEFLSAVDKRYILLRMLNNLRGIYLNAQQHRKALEVLEMILAINPASADDLKLRGVIHYRLGQHQQARRDLESYLFLCPDAPDAKDVKETLAELGKLSAMLN